jgi:nicotinate-nucleotide--dimethylbenzimidazole phosphoribosyltransferase
MRDLAELLDGVEPVDPRTARLWRVRQLTAARPEGSLGELDRMAARIAAIRGPGWDRRPMPAVVSVLAGDHGVAAESVSRFPYGLTGDVLRLVQAGQAPVNALAAQVGAVVHSADFGLRDSVGDQRFKVANGTRDIVHADAMSGAETELAVRNGAAYAREVLGDAPLVAVGEIGVGNTTSAAALAARLLGLAAVQVVGAGSGVTASVVETKRRLVVRAIERSRHAGDDPMRVLAALGGLEIAGNVGVIIEAVRQRRVVLIDGFITGVAALLAVRLCPYVKDYLVASHRSAEPGHAPVLAELGLNPLLSLGMRLGMASGAVLAIGLVNSALAVCASTPRATSVGLGAR